MAGIGIARSAEEDLQKKDLQHPSRVERLRNSVGHYIRALSSDFLVGLRVCRGPQTMRASAYSVKRRVKIGLQEFVPGLPIRPSVGWSGRRYAAVSVGT